MSDILFKGIVERNKIVYLQFLIPINGKIIDIPVDQSTAARIMFYFRSYLPPVPVEVERGNIEQSD